MQKQAVEMDFMDCMDMRGDSFAGRIFADCSREIPRKSHDFPKLRRSVTQEPGVSGETSPGCGSRGAIQNTNPGFRRKRRKPGAGVAA